MLNLMKGRIESLGIICISYLMSDKSTLPQAVRHALPKGGQPRLRLQRQVECGRTSV